MDNNTGGPFDVNPDALLEEAVMREFDDMPLLSSKCSIYRVPERLRHVNEKAYTPKVVSIGPFHHERGELKAMEEHKMRYLNYLVRITGRRLGSYIKVVRGKEAELRACYAEPNSYNSDEFVKIILVDAAFIIVFLVNLKFRNTRDEKDRIFGKPWMVQDVWFDMLLLENQLPFFILKDVFDHGIKILDTEEWHQVDIFELSYNFFKELMNLKVEQPKLEQIRSYGVEHFVDFLRHLYLPLNWQQEREFQTIATPCNTESHQTRIRFEVGSSRNLSNLQFRNGIRQHEGELQTISTPSVTELHQAGVKFRVGSSGNLFDIRFDNGHLEIPKLIIGEETEISIRNLLAFEQCYYEDNPVNDYVVIMNHLVNTQKDVDFVAKYRIVENRLGNNKKGSFLINQLTHGVILNFDKFYFASLSEQLNQHCRKSWHKWLADLRLNYFNTPWTIISLIAALIMLLLTLIQAVCSVISVKS